MEGYFFRRFQFQMPFILDKKDICSDRIDEKAIKLTYQKEFACRFQ